MKKEEFITKMEEKGYKLSTRTENTVFHCGLETVVVNDDDTLSSSNPAGIFAYKCYEDYFNGKYEVVRTYSIID